MFVSTRTAVLLAASVAAGAALAQQPAPQNARAPKPAASSAAALAPAAPASASPMAYRSAFDGYKGLTEQPVQSWRESNDTVGRIGGWQSYAREGQGGPAAGSARPSEAKGVANLPGVSGMPANHGEMKMPSTGGAAAAPMPPAANTPGPVNAPGRTLPRRARVPAASASTAMPADHTGHTKP